MASRLSAGFAAKQLGFGRRRSSSPRHIGRVRCRRATASCCSAACWTSMPRSVDGDGTPRRRRHRIQAVSQGVIHEVGDDLSGCRQSRIARRDRRRATAGIDTHADAGGVDDDVGTGHVADDARRTPALDSDAACSARSAFRLSTVMSAAPARPSASITERAAPPAPMTAMRAPRRRHPLVPARRRIRRRRCWNRRGSSPSQLTVLTDRNVRAAGSSRSTALATVGLVRHRDRQTAQIRGQPHRVERVRGPPERHVERGVHPVDTGGVEGRLVDDRREAVRDRRADDAGDPGSDLRRVMASGLQQSQLPGTARRSPRAARTLRRTHDCRLRRR